MARGLWILHRDYRRARIHSLRFELTYLKFVLGIKIQLLACRWTTQARDVLEEILQERFAATNGSSLSKDA